MAFRLDTEPVDAFSNETGAPIATGGTFMGEGTHPVGTVAATIVADTTYALVAPVTTITPGTISWEIEVTADGETWTESDGYGPDGNQAHADEVDGTGTSTRLWRATVDGTALFRAVVTGHTVTVTEPSVAPFTGRTILTVPGDILAENILASGGFVAGDPDGSRLEIDNDGLRAYNAAGVETAHIDGAEGVFVGGEFRTSDTLPGQVVMSDTALTLEGGASPGISVTPINALPYSEMPGIGPANDGMVISGGAFTTGEASGMLVRPNVVQQWAYTAGGGYAQVYTTGLQTTMERYDDSGALTSSVAVDDRGASVQFGLGGDFRGLYIKVDGVWVISTVGGVETRFNLEETAQDSGWQSFSTVASVTGSSELAWRNKGGIIWFRGTVTKAWTADIWNLVADGLPSEMTPDAVTIRTASDATHNVRLRVSPEGGLYVSIPTSVTSTVAIGALMYPTG